MALGEVDAKQAEVPAETPQETMPLPPPLFLAKHCFDHNLLVAPSQVILGSLGLYAGAKFRRGDIVTTGTSEVGKWLLPAEMADLGQRLGPLTPDVACVAEVDVLRLFRKSVRATLVGRKCRDAWTHMKFSVDGASVEARLGVGAMRDQFLMWMATRNIEPYEELLWKPPATSAADPCAGWEVEAIAGTPPAQTLRTEGSSPADSNAAQPGAAAGGATGSAPEEGQSQPPPAKTLRAEGSGPASSNTGQPPAQTLRAEGSGPASSNAGQPPAETLRTEGSGSARSNAGQPDAAAPGASAPEAGELQNPPAKRPRTESPRGTTMEKPDVEPELMDEGMLSEKLARPDPLDAAFVLNYGETLQELQQVKGHVLFLADPDGIHIVTQKKVKRIPGKSILHCAIGGEVSAENWQRPGAKVPYDLHHKSNVVRDVANGPVKLMDQVCRACPDVWGYQVNDGKLVAAVDSSGNEIKIAWKPRQEHERTVATLLACRDVEPLFLMAIEPGSGKKSALCPDGVVFMLQKPLLASEPSDVFTLPIVGSVS